ncbi:Ubl carboxyl-terminal hydrolase 18 [Oryzias melastigma]|uniref:Ubl carboxyl-terminal hydrolase 18 n=1 Tax=Oryzias melastigma TaxID=30732 RepID=A0A834FAG1_ORYME|nr:Ubl carboxyl-terminal hydrolase 18 [Oryzias melastigma]
MSSGICRNFYSMLWSTHLRMRGLSNYHLSCCVNTLLQTFSATWELVDLLEKWEPAAVRWAGSNVPLELKKVLTAMRGDLPQPAPHRDFLHCLDRNYIRLSTQHDADEVFLAILNLVHQQIDDRRLALEIQDLYKISVETYLQCLQCNSIQTLNSYQLSLPLHIKEDHNTLEDCMTSFFEHQELTGINCCSCAHCGTRNPSKQGVKLRSLPPILCIHLKRFRNTRGFLQKLHCRVTFPEHLNLAEILTEAFSTDFAEAECTFSLYAVVVHSGSAMSGHYTAYVREQRSMCWYHADDSYVQPVSWEDVQMTYGERSRETAYMLMYRRDLRKQEPNSTTSG